MYTPKAKPEPYEMTVSDSGFSCITSNQLAVAVHSTHSNITRDITRIVKELPQDFVDNNIWHETYRVDNGKIDHHRYRLTLQGVMAVIANSLPRDKHKRKLYTEALLTYLKMMQAMEEKARKAETQPVLDLTDPVSTAWVVAKLAFDVIDLAEAVKEIIPKTIEDKKTAIGVLARELDTMYGSGEMADDGYRPLREIPWLMDKVLAKPGMWEAAENYLKQLAGKQKKLPKWEVDKITGRVNSFAPGVIDEFLHDLDTNNDLLKEFRD